MPNSPIFKKLIKMADVLKVLCPQEYHRQFLLKGIRSDGRALDDFRSAAIQGNVISTADGSAMIRQGDSLVIASIQAELGRPRIDSPDQGKVEIRIQQSSTKWDLGGSGEEIRLHGTDVNFCVDSVQSLVDNGSLIDLKDLCLEKKKVCWILRCDMVILDGIASVDGFVTALSAALHSTTLPEVTLKPTDDNLEDVIMVSENGEAEEDEDDKDESLFTPERILVDTKKRRGLKLIGAKPIALSFFFFPWRSGEEESKLCILTDPSMEEMKALSGGEGVGSMTAVIGENNSICGLYLTGNGATVSDGSLDHCIALAASRRQLINRLITEACAK